MFDVLKRYLLIVWNFFFGQSSSESIQDSPQEQPENSGDVVPPGKVDDEIVKEAENDVDDIEEILNVEGEDDEEEVDYEDDEEEESYDEEVDTDQNKKEDTSKKPEDKIVVNDVPTKSTNLGGKIEDVKIPHVPEKKDTVEIKKPELPKANDGETEEKEKPKAKNDEIKKTEIPKLKPEFEVIEKESPKVVPSKLKSDFEVIEREAETQLPDTSELKPEFEIVEREVSKTAPAKDTPELKPVVEAKGKEAVPEKQDSAAAKPEVAGTGGSKVPPVKETPPEKQDSPKPPRAADAESPEKAGKSNRVKFDLDEPKKGVDGPAGAGDVGVAAKSSPPATDRKETRRPDDGVLPLANGTATTQQTIDAFIFGEQRHTVNQLHPESIQDQQLDYSDSGEELSDDDIEIDYEDDEDDEAEEVKPLPPVTRSVYKKND